MSMLNQWLQTNIKWYILTNPLQTHHQWMQLQIYSSYSISPCSLSSDRQNSKSGKNQAQSLMYREQKIKLTTVTLNLLATMTCVFQTRFRKVIILLNSLQFLEKSSPALQQWYLSLSCRTNGNQRQHFKACEFKFNEQKSGFQKRRWFSMDDQAALTFSKEICCSLLIWLLIRCGHCQQGQHLWCIWYTLSGVDRMNIYYSIQ